jgi:hypothetical protein
MTDFKYVRFFEQIGVEDVPLVGGKNASLGGVARAIRGIPHSRSGEATPSACTEPRINRTLAKMPQERSRNCVK